MLKKITILLGILALGFSSRAQLQWRQLPSNPNLVNASGYDIAVGDNGTFYVVYNLLNSGSGMYDIYFDFYSSATGWQNMLTYPTTNNSSIDVKTVHCGTNIYAMANTNSGSQMTLFQIGGQTAYELTTTTFTNFNYYASWDIYPGVSYSELYLAYNALGANRLYEFDYGTQAWTDHGDPYSTYGVSASDMDVYVNQDSVFVAGRYYNSPSDKIKVMAAQKGVWNWNHYSAPTGDLYAMNAGVADTVTTNYTFYLFGDQNNQLSALATDGTIREEIPVGMGAYGQRVSFPLNYDTYPDMATSSTRPYFMAQASNLANQDVVYERNPVTGVWSAIAAGPFAANSVSMGSKRIQTHSTTERLMTGYVDNTPNPAEYVLQLTNNPPTVLDNGNAIGNLCSNADNSLISYMTIGDLDGDNLTFLSVASSNTALINPADVYVSVSNGGPDTSIIYADAMTGNTSTTQTVTLTFNFTDGFDVVQYVHTYTVVPAPVVAWTTDTLTFCNNGDIADLYDYVTIPGGTFSAYESDWPSHYFDPTTILDPSSFNLDLHYYYSDGTCGGSADVNIQGWEAPSATISTTAASGCGLTDGTATLDITGGTTPYSFVWNIGNYTDLALTNLAAGTVHTDIIDANGCSVVADAIVANSAAAITGTVTPITCYGDANGAIDITVTGLTVPLTVLWSNGYSTEDVANLQPGTHSVWITDAAGCMLTESFDVPEPDALDLSVFGSGSDCGMATGSATVNYVDGGTAPFSYLWNTGSTADNLSNIPSGIYSLTVTDANGCTITGEASVYDFGAPSLYGIQVTNASCTASDGAISGTLYEQGTNTQIIWSNGFTTPSISGLPAGTYTVDVFNDEGCHTYDVFHVNILAPDRQPLCVVTVDSTTSTNLLVWEKTGDNLIDHYNMYRETTVPGQFQLIDTVQHSNLSIFNDVVASPIERSWKYRITAVNECGVESVPSVAHKTIHLTTTDLGNGDFKVIWNFYEGTTYTAFNVYRYTSLTGWQQIATTPGSLSYYLDTPPNTVGLDYMVDFDLTHTCTADFEKAQDFNSSRSNKDKGQFAAGNGTGDSNNGLIELSFGGGTVALYPNPVSGDAVFVKLAHLPAADYSIASITGQTVTSGQLSEGVTSIATSSLRPDIYILHLFHTNEHTSLRFIVD